MFRCTDCGQEYEIKPEYCDCGNNVFEEIAPAVQKKVETVPKTQAVRPQTVRKPLDLYSILIFVACIILSILSLIFIGKEGKSEQIAQTETAEVQKVDIPSIDKLWKESNKNSQTLVSQTQVPLLAPVQMPVAQTPKSKNSAVNPTQKVQTPKKTQALKTQPMTAKTPSTAQKTTAKMPTSQTQAQTQATVQNTPSMTEAQKEEIIKKLTKSNKPKTTPAPTSQASQSVQTAVQTPKPTTNQVQPAQTTPAVEVKQPEPPKVDYAALKRELSAYKVALRNKIGGNINFAGVIGDGKCAVTFKIDSAGNLIDRKFSLQSTNDSLNDAVYASMMQNPTFKAPPEGYKNETLTLSVKIYGGQFEVELK